ncbi:MAG: LysR family transcriptional regulator [Notoacmeibacter sp.]|nr:LysR family transcriptional regulator [Notoacmeibacter sp.]MCC0032808.1 LysR family transcriptional regulator [Brucellaceae bacterium]
MQEFDWNLVKGFLAVAETGSLSAAARKLAASQPTLGRHISELEAALGVTLFERLPRGMALTEAGTALLEHAGAMQAGSAALSLAATGRSAAIEGTLRITASQMVAHFLLPPVLARLHREEPGLHLEIVSSNTVENLLARDADIAIRMTAPQQAELVARKITDVAVGLFAAPAYLDRRGTPQALEDLLLHDFVGYDRDTQMLRGFAAVGHPVTRDFFPLRTDDQVLNWRLVEQGAGLGFTQVLVGLSSPHVVPVLPDLPLPALPMYLAAHRELRNSARIRRVFDFLAEELARLPLDARAGT